MALSKPIELAVRSALHSQAVPAELIDALLLAVEQMANQYAEGHIRPSELHGGDFAEAAFRIMQHFSQGSYTALGRTLPKVPTLLSQLEESSLDDSLRVHVPRVLQAIYDIRNRRGVGHLAGRVSANRSDAELILACAKWTLSEFLVLFHATPHDEAQKVVDLLAAQEMPIVEDFEGTKKLVTKAKVSRPNEILALLLAAEPEVPDARQIREWTGTTPSTLATALLRLSDRRLIHRFEDGRIRLTSLGRRQAEGLIRQLQQ